MSMVSGYVPVCLYVCVCAVHECLYLAWGQWAAWWSCSYQSPRPVAQASLLWQLCRVRTDL